MPRNNQGVYTLPAGNPVVAGTLIETTWANPTMSDIAAALTGSLPRDGSAPMTADLILANSAPSNPLAAASKAYVQSFMVYATGMPVGAAMPFLGNNPPPGFLVCNGQAVSRTTYAELFAVIGVIYGTGDGVTTFNVPDLRNQFIRGKADDRSVGSLQAGSFAAHTHPVQDPGHTHGATGSQAAHTHSVTTVAHNHGVSDPGHAHSASVWVVNGSSAAGGERPGDMRQTTIATAAAGTGISIQNAAPTGSADSKQPTVSVSVASATTNETIGSTGGTETVPQNMALIYVVKAVNDTAQVASVTSLSSSDSNMIAIDATNPAIPELDIKSNVAFGIPKLDASGKILLAQLPQGASLLGYFDASGGNNPSQEFPLTTYVNGEMYIVSVGGTILVFDPATGTESSTAVSVGGTLLFLDNPLSSPTGWYYSVPAVSSTAANIAFQPEGTIGATNVQAAIAELDGEKAALTGATFTGQVKGIAPVADQDLTRKDYVDDGLDARVAVAGDSMTGPLEIISLTGEAGTYNALTVQNAADFVVDRGVGVAFENGLSTGGATYVGGRIASLNTGVNGAGDSRVIISASKSQSLNNALHILPENGLQTGADGSLGLLLTTQQTTTSADSVKAVIGGAQNPIGPAGSIMLQPRGGVSATVSVWTEGIRRMTVQNAGTVEFSTLVGTGNRAVYSTPTGGLTNTASDAILKKDAEPISYGLTAVMAMKPVSYGWINTENYGAQREIGFIAQDMRTVVPEVIGTNADGTLSLDYAKLVAVLTKAVQELSTKVSELEVKCAGL